MGEVTNQIALLRGPGQSLREQLDKAHNDLTWDIVLRRGVPLLALALFPAQSPLYGLPQSARLAPVYALAAIAVIAYMLRKLLKPGTRLDHLKAGHDAEVAVECGRIARLTMSIKSWCCMRLFILLMGNAGCEPTL